MHPSESKAFWEKRNLQWTKAETFEGFTTKYIMGSAPTVLTFEVPNLLKSKTFSEKKVEIDFVSRTKSGNFTIDTTMLYVKLPNGYPISDVQPPPNLRLDTETQVLWEQQSSRSTTYKEFGRHTKSIIKPTIIVESSRLKSIQELLKALCGVLLGIGLTLLVESGIAVLRK